MKRKTLSRLFMPIILFFLVVLPINAEESGPIDVQLTILKVESAPGSEVLVPLVTIRPGDLLQYEIVYRVKGNDEVLELLAQLPIPDGMEYVPDSAKPQKVLASLDGVEFLPLPLPDKEKLADGQASFERIGAKKYRTLGWTMRGLAPGNEFTVSARFKVDFIPEQK